MASTPEHVIELIFGRWRSQILYAGAALGVFDHLGENRATDAPALAPRVGADPALLYRLLRALAAIGLLAEDDRRGFRLTEAGALLRKRPSHTFRRRSGSIRSRMVFILIMLDWAAVIFSLAMWMKPSTLSRGRMPPIPGFGM